MKKVKHVGMTTLFGAAIILTLLLVQKSCAPEPVLSTYEEHVNRITEIDYSKRQEELNALVEEGKMNVNYLSKAVFNGKVSEKFNVTNIQNNHDAIAFRIFDEDGTCIYQSKKIRPGYEMNSIELEKSLSKGVHECKIQIGYAVEGNVSSAFPITIEVK